jgi:hypothetical protein
MAHTLRDGNSVIAIVEDNGSQEGLVPRTFHKVMNMFLLLEIGKIEKQCTFKIFYPLDQHRR